MKPRLYATIAALFALPLAAACSSDAAGDQSGIVVASAGGSYLDWEKAHIQPRAEELYPELDITYASSSTPDIAAKVLAEQQGERGTYDVVLEPDNLMAELHSKDAIIDLDFSKIPNAEHQLANLSTDYSVAVGSSPFVLIYNSTHVQPDPSSYAVLWDEDYAGKIGVMSSHWTEYFYAAGAVANGGYSGERDWDVPEEMITELGQAAKVYPGHDQLGAALASGEIWMAVNYLGRAQTWGAENPDIKYVFPDEGTYRYYWAYGIPKNASNVEGAYKYLNALLDTKAQGSVAADFGYAPTTDNAELTAELEDKFTPSPEQAEKIMKVDATYLAEMSNEWEQLWARRVVQGR